MSSLDTWVLIILLSLGIGLALLVIVLATLRFSGMAIN